MSTLSDIRTLVLDAVARDDSVATSIADAAINYSVMMAALMFEPPELFSKVDVILTGGTNVMHFPNLVDIDIDETDYMGLFEIDDNGDVMPIAGSDINTNLLDVISIYDKTNSRKLDFIPYESWEVYVPTGLTVLRYWTKHGISAYFKAAPSSNVKLAISYSSYPSALEADTDPLPFDHHDSFIVSSAIGICWAAFEEGESAQMWNQIASVVGNPSGLGTRARAILEGRRVLLESAIAQKEE